MHTEMGGFYEGQLENVRSHPIFKRWSQVIQRAWSSSAKSKIHWHPSLAANFKHAWKLMWTLVLKCNSSFFWLLKRARTITVPHPRTVRLITSKPFFLGGSYNRLLVEERSKWTTMTWKLVRVGPGVVPNPGFKKIQDQIEKLSLQLVKLSAVGIKSPWLKKTATFLISRGHGTEEIKIG